MLDSPPMPEAGVAVIDALNSLLEAELSSIVRFMGEGSPYLSRANAAVRQPLADMVQTSHRHAAELYQLIESLGGYAVPHAGLQREDQYLAYLSLKFLLPKLAEAKALMVRRYENAIAAVAKDAPPEVRSMLEAHRERHRQDMEVLQAAATEALAEK